MTRGIQDKNKDQAGQSTDPAKSSKQATLEDDSETEDSNITQGQSGFRDIKFDSKGNLENSLNLQKLTDKDNMKYVSEPLSSDSSIMRTSYKVRFEVVKKNSMIGGSSKLDKERLMQSIKHKLT